MGEAGLDPGLIKKSPDSPAVNTINNLSLDSPDSHSPTKSGGAVDQAAALAAFFTLVTARSRFSLER